MIIVLCPGMTPPEATESFRRHFTLLHRYLHFFIPPTIAPYDGPAIANYIQQQCPPDALLLFIGFSAGVVGAVYAARVWQSQGGAIAALWAWDGWGMPLAESFPTVRVSHDHFTHWSSAVLGAGEQQFWADPPVTHLELWQEPHRVVGWQAMGWGQRQRLTLLEFCSNSLVHLKPKNFAEDITAD